jgi:hypothetical protein
LGIAGQGACEGIYPEPVSAELPTEDILWKITLISKTTLEALDSIQTGI